MLNNNFLKTKFKFFLFLFFLFYSHISFSSELEILSDEVGNGLEIKEHYKVKVNYKGSLENGNVFLIFSQDHHPLNTIFLTPFSIHSPSKHYMSP